MVDEIRAPRFRAFLEYKYGVLILERSLWDQLLQTQEELVLIDIAVTPLHDIAVDAKVVGTFIDHEEGGDPSILIFREDPNDFPLEINRDTYDVWEDIVTRIDYPKTIASADTDDDLALRGFVADYVFIVRKDKGEDHQMPELPAKYRAVLAKG